MAKIGRKRGNKFFDIELINNLTVGESKTIFNKNGMLYVRLNSAVRSYCRTLKKSSSKRFEIVTNYRENYKSKSLTIKRIK